MPKCEVCQETKRKEALKEIPTIKSWVCYDCLDTAKNEMKGSMDLEKALNLTKKMRQR